MTTQTQATKIARNATSNVGRFALSALIQFLLTPLVVHHLGATGFGIWSLSFAALGFVSLLEFGLGTAVVRATATTTGQRDDRRRNQVLSTLAFFHLVLSAAALVSVAILVHGFTRWFDVTPEHAEAVRAVAWLLGLRLALVVLPLGFFRNVLFGRQRIGAINLVQLISQITYALAAWGMLIAGGDVIALAWLNLLSGAAEYTAYAVLCFRLVPNFELRARLVDWKLVPELLSFSGASFLITISALVLLRTDPLIVKLALPLASVALYAVALKVVENGHLLVKQVINVLAPFVAQLHGAGEAYSLRTVFVVVARHALWAGSLLAAGLSALGEPALVHWVGPEFRDAAPVMSVLMLAATLLIPQMVAANILMMTGSHRFMALASLLGVVLNVSASVILVFQVGLIGVALGTLIATLVIDCWLVLWRTCQLQGVGYFAYLWRVFVPAAVCGLVQYLVSAAALHHWPPANLFQVLLIGLPGVLSSAIVYGAVFAKVEVTAWLRVHLSGRARGAARSSLPSLDCEAP